MDGRACAGGGLTRAPAHSVLRADGTEDELEFPVPVSADQVFTDISGLRHAVVPGGEATATFSFCAADVFEMEDQRQWLDGSFKSYFRPLRRTPLPYALEPGDCVEQSVTLTLSGTPEASDGEGKATSPALGPSARPTVSQIG